MNLHLVQDTVFINDFADLLSGIGEIENNHFYVYYSESAKKNEHKHLIKEKFSGSKIVKAPLEELHVECNKYKNIFIHLLSDLILDFVEKVDTNKTKLHWCTWGSDFYGPDEIFTSMVFDEDSANIFNKWNQEHILENVKRNKIPLNITYFYKLAQEEHRYSLRKKQAFDNYENSKLAYLKRKKELAKKFTGLLNYGYEDYVFIKSFYEINPDYYSLFYTMFDETDNKVKESTYLINRGIKSNDKKIFIGNCATLHNNHLELIPVLKTIKRKYREVKFIVPLSYGPKKYSDFISKEYKKELGDSFYPIYDFIEKQEYYSILNSIDVMIMNHNVNQGGTNLFKAIYYGKRIFIKDRNPLGIHLRKNGVIMDNIESLESNISNLFEKLSPEIIAKNKIAINSIFSTKNAEENIKLVLAATA